MPKVCSAVKANFPEGTPFGAGLVPDEAVAIGATIQAFLLQVRPQEHSTTMPYEYIMQDCTYHAIKRLAYVLYATL